MILRPPRSPLFPYTTLFRSRPIRWCKKSRWQPRIAPPRPSTSGRAQLWHIPTASRIASFAPSSVCLRRDQQRRDRKSTRLNSSHDQISYAVFCLKKKKKQNIYCTKQLEKGLNCTSPPTCNSHSTTPHYTRDSLTTTKTRSARLRRSAQKCEQSAA